MLPFYLFFIFASVLASKGFLFCNSLTPPVFFCFFFRFLFFFLTYYCALCETYDGKRVGCGICGFCRGLTLYADHMGEWGEIVYINIKYWSSWKYILNKSCLLLVSSDSEAMMGPFFNYVVGPTVGTSVPTQCIKKWRISNMLNFYLFSWSQSELTKK